jgi:hypothetical protein
LRKTAQNPSVIRPKALKNWPKFQFVQVVFLHPRIGREQHHMEMQMRHRVTFLRAGRAMRIYDEPGLGQDACCPPLAKRACPEHSVPDDGGLPDHRLADADVAMDFRGDTHRLGNCEGDLPPFLIPLLSNLT